MKGSHSRLVEKNSQILKRVDVRPFRRSLRGKCFEDKGLDEDSARNRRNCILFVSRLNTTVFPFLERTCCGFVGTVEPLDLLFLSKPKRKKPMERNNV